MCVRVSVYICHSLPSWPPEGGWGLEGSRSSSASFLSHSVTQIRSTEADASPRAQNFLFPFPPIHQSVCVNIFCLRFLHLYVLPVYFAHSCTQINKCKSPYVHWNSKYVIRLSCRLCCMHMNQTWLHAVIVHMVHGTERMLTFKSKYCLFTTMHCRLYIILFVTHTHIPL